MQMVNNREQTNSLNLTLTLKNLVDEDIGWFCFLLFILIVDCDSIGEKTSHGIFNVPIKT